MGKCISEYTVPTVVNLMDKVKSVKHPLGFDFQGIQTRNRVFLVIILGLF